ncbi:Uncharacterised protein [Mycobacterium tuberculosis]|uniref:Uncharacterized protein n=1 Tax=Mycobacterium tuberculosis TaxID=1773 RepID=A0A655FD20_MYCTX|nr:Uncharacterised protein [Mycobacterium tuberculosis]CKS18234.1 Uncharacterised protein [Mycobacterium tuberculosis]CKT45422.1 Uncharacterised protein [Mycobacterium tuberculosis]CKU61484.1 Uncharacterised protein [Mycobacterium tuberculosis]CNU51303.1 Uncharacterised protein [Mycobacterium tuberculosis]
MQSVGTDNEVELAGRRALKGHPHRVAVVLQCGNAVVEQVFNAGLSCPVEQFDKIVT